MQSTSSFPLKTQSGSFSKPHFCVQSHAASHFHYDFRLEYKGVLLSWVIPKQPSLDSHEKRLAIQTEDHSIDYQYFEGTIPKGTYGAGKVKIWDSGTYYLHGATSKKQIEKSVAEGLKKGHFVITLEGNKLQGEFVFQRFKDDKSWLFIKKKAEPTC